MTGVRLRKIIGQLNLKVARENPGVIICQVEGLRGRLHKKNETGLGGSKILRTRYAADAENIKTQAVQSH